MIVGGLGLLSNIVGLLLFHGKRHSYPSTTTTYVPQRTLSWTQSFALWLARGNSDTVNLGR